MFSLLCFRATHGVTHWVLSLFRPAKLCFAFCSQMPAQTRAFPKMGGGGKLVRRNPRRRGFLTFLFTRDLHFEQVVVAEQACFSFFEDPSPKTESQDDNLPSDQAVAALSAASSSLVRISVTNHVGVFVLSLHGFLCPLSVFGALLL